MSRLLYSSQRQIKKSGFAANEIDTASTKKPTFLKNLNNSQEHRAQWFFEKFQTSCKKESYPSCFIGHPEVLRKCVIPAGFKPEYRGSKAFKGWIPDYFLRE